MATKENFLVKGHVMQRQQTTNSFSCTHLCLRRKGCLTFNFKLSSKRQGLCELSSETAGYFDDGLTEEAGWQYGQIVRIQKKASAGIDIPGKNRYDVSLVIKCRNQLGIARRLNSGGTSTPFVSRIPCAANNIIFK